MAYSFPLSRAAFMDRMPIARFTIDIPEAVEVSETGGGELLTAELGTRLWQGEIVLGKMTPDEAADALAMIDAARQQGGSFLVHDVSRPGPRLDLDGAVLGSATPAIQAVGASGLDIKLSGLPGGYRLRRYDYLGFTYASGPVRFALHRAINAVTVTAGGVMEDWLSVSPQVRPGWAVGAPVTLLNAPCKAIILPGSVQPGTRSQTMTEGASFKWRQTLR